MINKLEAAGITWAWVNDASIQEASLTKEGDINIRGNNFQALLLPNVSVIQLKTAEKIKELTAKGMRLMATGVLPTKQPSFLNWQVNDNKTAQAIAAALTAKNSHNIKDGNGLNAWINTLRQPLKFNADYSFTLMAEREMEDGSRIRFICDKSNDWQTISITYHK